MAFNVEKFERAEFVPRTKRVAVPNLAQFFDKGEAPEWEVRGLTANELQKAVTAKQTGKLVDEIVKAIDSSGDVAKELQKKLGLGKEVPSEVAKRLEMLVAGSVNPSITLSAAVKFAENFCVDFIALTNEITELTGMGFEYVQKPKAALPKVQNS